MLMSRAGLKGVTGRPKWRRARPDLVSADLVEIFDDPFRRYIETEIPLTCRN